jgi:hypothetical protein
MPDNQVPDTLNSVGLLNRREIEARMVGPVLERLAAEFGDGVYAVAGEAIKELARNQGAALAEATGDDSLASFARALADFSADGALESEVVDLTDDTFGFDVHRCRYAEMYQALGIPELGATMSCNRDGSLIEGFNSDIEFTRTQTIMGGATHCDFRFRVKPQPVEIDR